MNPDLADIAEGVMLDTLEQQYERGEPLRAEFVWELLNRAHRDQEGWRAENDRHRALYVEAVKERNDLREAIGGVSSVVMPNIGHGGHYEYVVAAVQRAVAERDRLRAALLLSETEQTALKWAMGLPWFERFGDPATREAAFGDLCVRLEAVGHDEEAEELRQRVHALREYASGVEAERDRLRAVVDAAREYRRIRDDESTDARGDDDLVAEEDARDKLYEALDQLDTTGVIGGELMVHVNEDETDGGFVASMPERPGVLGQGQTPETALLDLAAALSTVNKESFEGTLRGVGGPGVRPDMPCHACGAPIAQCIDRWAPCCERCLHGSGGPGVRPDGTGTGTGTYVVSGTGPEPDDVSPLGPDDAVVIRGVVITRSELEQLAGTKRALGAHRAGVPVSLDHETGEWTINRETADEARVDAAVRRNAQRVATGTPPDDLVDADEFRRRYQTDDDE